MSSAALQREVLLDHSRHPRGAGLREPYDARAAVVNPVCGDEVVLHLTLDGQVLAEVSHEALGCTLSRASTSVMTELVTGRTAEEALAVREQFVAMLRRGTAADGDDELGDAVALAGAGRYPSRTRCALLAWTALADVVAPVLIAR